MGSTTPLKQPAAFVRSRDMIESCALGFIVLLANGTWFWPAQQVDFNANFIDDPKKVCQSVSRQRHKEFKDGGARWVQSSWVGGFGELTKDGE